MGTKITELPPATFIADNAEFAISQDILLPGGRDTYKVTMSQLSSYITSTLPTPVAMPLYPGTGGGGGSSSVDSVPVGTICWFAASTPPTGYKECNGEILGKVTYNDLWLVIGDTFSSPTSANHFKIPDLRGEFVRGWSNGKAGVNTGRTFGSSESDMFKSHTHSLDNALTWPSRDGYPAVAEQNQSGPPEDRSAYLSSTSSTGGPETRPRNVALLPCIKFEYTIASSMVSLNFIKTPTITPRPGDSLVFDGATNTWVPSAVPTAPQQVNQPYTAKAFGSILYRPGTDTRGVNQTSHVVSSGLYNVSSITWKSRGLYTVTFTTPMANTNYVAIAQNSPAHDPSFTDAGGNTRFFNSPYQDGNENSLFIVNKTVNSFEILCWSQEENEKENMNGFSFVVFGL
jgi:microcystin-dependent protein